MLKWFSKRNFSSKNEKFPEISIVEMSNVSKWKISPEYQLLKRRCVCMNFFNFLKFLIFFNSFFFICVLIFFRFWRDHYFLRNQLIVDMHLWKKHDISTQKCCHSMLSNRSRDFRAKIFISMISIRTLSVR